LNVTVILLNLDAGTSLSKSLNHAPAVDHDDAFNDSKELRFLITMGNLRPARSNNEDYRLLECRPDASSYINNMLDTVHPVRYIQSHDGSEDFSASLIRYKWGKVFTQVKRSQEIILDLDSPVIDSSSFLPLTPDGGIRYSFLNAE
jgi:hypothetical protein